MLVWVGVGGFLGLGLGVSLGLIFRCVDGFGLGLPMSVSLSMSCLDKIVYGYAFVFGYAFVLSICRISDVDCLISN